MIGAITIGWRVRGVALACAVGVVGFVATTAAEAASKSPLVGAGCQLDGHINGSGADVQQQGVNDSFTYGYQQDVCGPAGGPEPNLNPAYVAVNADPSQFTFGSASTSVQGMVAYNYALGGTAAADGSGSGLLRMSCRTDFFAGTDLPYNNAQLVNVDGTPGMGGACSGLNTGAVPPPFGPQTSVGYPNTSDAAANMMAFPVAAGAVAYAVNLNGMCTNGTPTGLNVTADEFDKIWQGAINQWNDPELVATNPILATDGCAGNIQRIVRFDNAGDTAITMFTLYGIDGAAQCGSASTWYAIATASTNAGQWPQCGGPNPVTAGVDGSAALINLVSATNGGFGYAEAGLWPSPLPPGVSLVNLQTYADEQTPGNGLTNANPGPDGNGNPAFIGAGTPGLAPNCGLPAQVPTGATGLQAVGLGSPNWSDTGTNNGGVVTPGKQDIAWSSQRSGYPACGLTFDTVYHGVEDEIGELGGAGGTPGCTGNPTNTTNGVQTLPPLPYHDLILNSAAGFPSGGVVEVTSSAGDQYLAYNLIVGSTLYGIPSSGPGGGTGTVPSGTTVSLITGSCQSVQGPLTGATDDQLRTLYSYFTYVLSPLGQSRLPDESLNALPSTWLTEITQGFQQNF